MSNYEQLKAIKGVGQKRYEQITTILVNTNTSLDTLFTLSPEEIKTRFSIPINVARAISTYKTTTSLPVSSKSQIARAPNPSSLVTIPNVLKLTLDDPRYPQKLKTILGDKAPTPLYVWGNLNLLNKPGIGFCGSRNVTEKGLQVTADAAEQIAKHDWVVISGHARGVDITAHETALKNNSGTIIVIPEGINKFRLKKSLRDIAKATNLLVISEFPPDAAWNVGYAMKRNQTIIGLSDAMILIEARMKGGTFNAGKMALQMEHPLFVANYNQQAENNAGNQYFLQKGAKSLLKNKTTGRANMEAVFAVVEKSQDNLTRHIQQLKLDLERS